MSLYECVKNEGLGDVFTMYLNMHIMRVPVSPENCRCGGLDSLPQGGMHRQRKTYSLKPHNLNIFANLLISLKTSLQLILSSKQKLFHFKYPQVFILYLDSRQFITDQFFFTFKLHAKITKIRCERYQCVNKCDVNGKCSDDDNSCHQTCRNKQ